MGFFFSKLAVILSGFSDRPARVVMLGLDAAGKTTVLYKLKFNESVTTIPTIGFNVETVNPCKGLTITIWDVGGQDKIRRLWHHYYQNTDGMIFVVDSADPTRLGEASEELNAILQTDEMRSVPVLVFANKQDLPDARSVAKIAEALRLNRLQRKWHVQACCAVNGDGLLDGFEHFAQMIKEYQAASKH